MKKSILCVSGTLWAFSCLIGKSCPSAIYPFNTDDSHDGAILAKNSNKLDLPRDLSQPIIARFARDVTGEDPKVPPLLIIIIPVVMGIVVIIIIVLVVCYLCRRSGRGSCFSNEWLIWCGLMKRSNPSSEREPDDHRSDNASHAPSVRRGVRYEPGQNAMSPTPDESVVRLLSHHLQTPQPVGRGNHTGARPTERSPSPPNTPNTGNSSLPPSDVETDCSPRTTATVHHSGTQPKATKFRYSNIIGGQDGSTTVEQTGGTRGAMYQSVDNIPENESIGGGRDNAKADRSGSDDDVFITGIDGVHVEEDEREIERLLPNKLNYANESSPGEVSHGDHSSQVGERKSPSNASPGDTYQEISGQIVHVHFHSPVDTVHVGDKETKYFFPKDGTDTINNNTSTCAFHRFALERKTH